MNLTQNVPSAYDSRQSHIRRLSEEIPQADTQQQDQRESRRAIGKLQEFDEHHIHHTEQH